MTRVLKRPMFRLGGNTDQGIMSGVVPRQGYSNGNLAEDAAERKKLLMGLAGQAPDRSMSNMLIDFGLNIASATPKGSIFATAAESAKDPFQRYQTSKAKRSAYDQQVGLAAAESAIAHRDKMKELALKGQTTDLLTEQKRAKIMWNNRRTETNPSGSYNTDTGEDWGSYQEVEAFVVDKAIKSKTGEYTPKVEKDIAINEIFEFMVENDENVPDAYSNAQQMKEIAEISYNVNNDPLYEDIKKQFDYNQIVIDPKNFGDKLPATETAGSTSYQLKDYNSSEDPDYQHNKIYHNYEDGNFYIFNGTGNGSFILVTLTKE